MSREVGPADPADDAGPASAKVTGDRTITPVAGRLGRKGGDKGLLFAALVAGSGLLLLVSWKREAPQPTKPMEPARQIVRFDSDLDLKAPRGPAPTLANPGGDPPKLGNEDAQIPPLVPRASGALPADRQPGDRPTAAPAPMPPLLVYSRAERRPAEPPSPIADDSRVSPAAPTELDGLRQASSVLRLHARRLPDRNFLLLGGAAIPCVLQTALDSTTPGFVTCILSRDVLSDNSAVVLLERGSRVMGEYRSSMRQGQGRIFVLWSRIVTPSGVVVALASPASDELGRAGFGGEVDTLFWSRFGGALLLSLVDDAAATTLGSSDWRQSARLPSDAAAVALQGSIDKAPILRKPQGSQVSIFVAHDLDFAGVYGLAEP